MIMEFQEMPLSELREHRRYLLNSVRRLKKARPTWSGPASFRGESTIKHLMTQVIQIDKLLDEHEEALAA